MAAYVFAGLLYGFPLLGISLLFLLGLQCYDSAFLRIPDCQPGVDLLETLAWSVWISWLPALLAALGSGLSKRFPPGWTLLWAFLGGIVTAFVVMALAALLGQYFETG